MSRYEDNLLTANSQLSLRIISLRKKLVELCEQRGHPLQDDWDDAVTLASEHIALAERHVERALLALKEGT